MKFDLRGKLVSVPTGKRELLQANTIFRKLFGKYRPNFITANRLVISASKLGSQMKFTFSTPFPLNSDITASSAGLSGSWLRRGSPSYFAESIGQLLKMESVNLLLILTLNIESSASLQPVFQFSVIIFVRGLTEVPSTRCVWL
jgi:hypothetical protein